MKKYWMVMLAVLFSSLTHVSISAMNIMESDTVSIWVNGLCGMCKTRIEQAALKTKGVESAQWDSETRILKVQTNPEKFKESRLHFRIASAGHDTRSLLAPDQVYNSLPGCCKYRDFETHDEATGGGKNKVTGFVYETDGEENRAGLPGANVYWLGFGSGTITDETGLFQIEIPEKAHMLVISYVGYGSDTLHISEPVELEFEFRKSQLLEEVQIIYRVKPTSFSFTSAFKIQTISENELTKAACCNLSESFETNPAVDVSYTDAVTGTRQIELLGLAGPYVQITRENMPDVRGLSSLYGLTYTPGSWIESIQLNMGSGSVVNGFESITGQINVELKKPNDEDKLFLNLYGNGAGRMEGNLNIALPVNEKWSTGILLHGKYQPFKLDRNGDSFLDNQIGNQLIALNRWKYSGDNGLQSQFGLKMTYMNNQGGQMDFNPEVPGENQSFWGSSVVAKRIEGWAKIGKIYKDKPFTSIGLQLSGVAHVQEAYFGMRDYNSDQYSFYSNLIYQSIIGNTNHQYRTGASFQVDQFDEKVLDNSYNRLEIVPGIFYEYTFNHLDIFTAVAGIRADYHNIYGLFFTPRVHLRYAPRERTVFRASAGRGQKTASIFAENIGLFASSREIFIENNSAGLPYGLEPEVAWNFGLNFSQGVSMFGNEAILNLDFYHTSFSNQIVVDYEQNPQEIHFYNLTGRSYSNSFQAQIDIEPLDRFDVRLAYRFNDVRTTYADELLSKPLSARNRSFINLAYATIRDLKFDLTWNWIGSKRIPGTETNPEEYRRPSSSPGFSVINMQVSKLWANKFEIYVGAENLFNFRQENPIIASDDPYGNYFDGSMIWGPVFGRKIYVGLRFKI